MKKPVLLIIIDGFGIRAEKEFNAILCANTPNYDALTKNYPCTRLVASGGDVGLPEGQMGNSEVGHLNLGAGRIVYQDYTRINRAIAEGAFFENPAILGLCETVRKAGSALHLIGLLSDGGVHSHIEHIFAAIRIAKKTGVKRLFLHAFLDGRDTPPSSGAGYTEELLRFLDEEGCGAVSSVCGRYYGMDRDNRWDRVETAYGAIVLGEGRAARDPVSAIRESYEDGKTDEFVPPTVIMTDSLAPVGTISDGDGVFFINFRADRAREMTRALTFPDFSGFVRKRVPNLSSYLTMTQYDEKFPFPIAFPPLTLRKILGEVISDLGKNQLRIAETEKYAHVTFFFSGGEEHLFAGEDRSLIPSPRDVPTYDLKPEMSAFAVKDAVIEKIGGKKYALIVLNFANPDMVGHTGVMDAAIRAVETVDLCVGEVVTAAQNAGYSIFITADHGNAEEMWDFTNNEPHTAHTTNPVPLIVVDEDYKRSSLMPGILADVAPTILDVMEIEKPAEMTGKSLFAKRP